MTSPSALRNLHSDIFTHLSKPFLFTLLALLIGILISPSVHGASLTINVSSTYVEDSATTVSIIVNDETPFNGTITFSANDLQLNSSQLTIFSSGFIGSHFNGTLSLTGADPGAFSLYASLVNSSTSAIIATTNATGSINSSAPQVVLSSPSGIVTKDNALLIVQTNEIATCRFSTSNATYDSMTSLSNTDSTRHNHTITSLSEGSYTYYVRCKDGEGHVMNNSHSISFMVDVPPTAVVSLSDLSPVKQGTIKVTLTLSESVSAAPILQYNYDDSSAKKSVSLTGSGKNWEGYLIISEGDNNKIGAFSFSAIDSAGNSGTTITSGSIFLVDTTKPVAPTSLRSTILSNGDVQLDWYFDGEIVDYYRIYRTISSGVQYVDHYDDADVKNSSLRYVDSSALDKVTYYYRISAVDEAGNEGPLSDEIYATSLATGASSVSSSSAASSTSSPAQEEIPRVLPPNLVYHVTDYVKKLDKSILDVESASSALLGQTDPDKKELLSEFGILQGLEAGKAGLQDLKAQALELKNYYHTEDELLAKLSSFALQQRKIELTTPKDISLKEKAEHIQTTSKEDIRNAANYVLQSSSLTEKETKEYLKLNEKNKDLILVTSSIKVIGFTYLDGAQKEKTFIKKSITASAPDTLHDVVLFEFIPKTIAANVNELTFLTPNYEVVEEDPVVKFGFLNFRPSGEEISYTVEKGVSLEEAKNAKSVVLLSLNELTNPDNQVTGFSISSLSGLGSVNSLFVWGGVIMIMGLLGYYLLFLNGYETVSRGARRKINIMKLQHDLSSLSGRRANSDAGAMGRLPLSEQESHLLLNEIYTHVDSAKQNMADQLLPALFSLHSKIAQKKGDDDALSITEMVQLANFHLQRGDNAKAAQFYKRINALYSSLPKETKAEVYQECAALHELLRGKL